MDIKIKEFESLYYLKECVCEKNLIVCELDLYCYFLGKIKWSMGFRDIVTKYWLVNDKSICVLCDDGLDYAFSLESGKLVEVNE